MDDFITGVNWIINNLDKSVMENQLQKVKDKFNMENVGLQYKNLYLDVLNNKMWLKLFI